MKRSRGDAVFAVIGAASGLGNAFRFPTLCAQYGIVFVAVYALMLVAVCLPLLCAELHFGRQICGGRRGKIWRVILRAATLNSAFIAAYYGVICAKLGSMGAAFAIFTGEERGGTVLFVVTLILTLATAFFILREGNSVLAKTGKITVISSLVMFSVLAVMGLVGGNGIPKVNFSCLAGGAVWADALGQALLALSLASGIMPSFARVHRVKVLPAALAIIGCNLLGCTLSALATAPYIPFIAQTVGIRSGLELYKTAVFALFPGKTARSLAGTAVFAVLTLVAIHSLCSLANPFVSKLVGNIKGAAVKRLGAKNLVPACFCLFSALLAPLFMYSGIQVLTACDRMACSVTAVVIAFAECLFFALSKGILPHSQGHSMGAIAFCTGFVNFFIRFFCPAVTGALALFSLCSARFDCFPPLATATAFVSASAIALAAPLTQLTIFVKRFKIRLKKKAAGANF